MTAISSLQNEKIKYLRSLYIKKYRQREERVVLEGIRLIEEALLAGAEVEDIFVTPDLTLQEDGRFKELMEERNINLHRVEAGLMEKISDTKTPQGILAIARKPGRYVSELETAGDARFLILDRVQDPGNLGTIIRTAAGAGYSGVILCKGTVDPFNVKALRASMGGVFRIPLYFGREGEIIENLQRMNIKFYAADTRGASDYFQISYETPLALIIGNEAHGVSERFLKTADAVVKIPLPGGIESLNVAVATGILLYYTVFENNSK